MNTSLVISGRLFAAKDETAAVDAALSELRRGRIAERIWQKDHTVWKQDPVEISNRLGWLTVAEMMRPNAGDLASFADAIRADGYQHVVLLGMGGSSLCPEVLRVTFGARRAYPKLLVLDSTVPAWVRRITRSIDPARTLFIVSSKSGGTIEVLSFFKHFWHLVEKRRGRRAGENFIAITDSGTRLGALATQHGFRRTFVNPSDIGGRYSALSYFGLVPAALAGIDIVALLDRARTMIQDCRTDAFANPGARLGATLGALATSGRDKLSLITSPSIAAFGLWVEQLLAESTGKAGKGIVPIALEPPAPVNAYTRDRLFVVLRVSGDANAILDRHMATLINAGQPVMHIDLQDRFDLGAEFFRWEMATAIAGHILGIQPFDQPNVQGSKDNTERMLNTYQASGALPAPIEPPRALRTAQLAEFLQTAGPNEYVALMAFLDETPYAADAIAELRSAILGRYHLTTTLGYGPRFLHSTGQLHKGGANNGLFIQLTSRTRRDLPIPGELFSFGVLVEAQAAGDLAALHARGRRAIRIDLGSQPAAGIRRLTDSIRGASRRPAARASRATPSGRGVTPGHAAKQRPRRSQGRKS